MVDVGTAVGYLMLDTTGFQSGFQSALRDLQTFRDESATAADKFSAAGSAMSAVGGSLTKSVTLPIVGLGSVITKVTSDFESSMSKVASIAGLDTVGEEFEALSEKAKEMGATTKFSASEAADAFTYMAMAGWKTESMLDGIDGIMQLAAASGEDLATTSDIVTDALTAFGLQAKDSSHFADILAAASNNANTNVSMLGESFKYVAPVAGALGYSAEDTSIALGLMANSGIKASQAGTSLRTAMSNLVSPTSAMAKVMDQYGISITDAEGNMKPFMAVMTDLREKLGGLDEATQAAAASTLFGKDAMSGMLAIINASDEDFNKLTESIYNADGTAAQMADTMQNNLSGQLTILGSTLEGLALSFGEILIPVITDFVKWLTSVVNKFNSLSERTKKVIVVVAAVAAAIGPLLLVLGKVSSAIGSIMGIVTKAAGAWSTWTSGLAAVGSSAVAVLGPIIAVVGVIAILVAAFKTLWDTNEEFRNGITETWNGIKESFSEFADGLLDRINSLGFDFESLTQVLGAVWQGFCDLLGPIFQGAFDQIGIILETVFGVITGLFDTFKGLFTGDWDTFWQGITGIFSSLWNGVTSTIENVFSTIGDLVNVILGEFGTSWQELWQGVVDFFSNAWNSILDFFTSIGTTISQAFQSFIDGVISFFSNLPENLGFLLGQAIGHVARFVVDLGQKAIEAGQNFLTNVVNFFQQLPEKIQSFLTNAINNVRTWASDLPNQARQAGQNFINGVVQFFQTLPSRIQTFLTSAINTVRNWGPNMLSVAKNAASTVVNGIVNTFSSLPGKMVAIGQNLVNGLKNGIMGALSGLLSSIQSFASGVISGFKAGFGIHSPSTIMIEQGLMLAKGLSVGLKNGKDGVLKTVEDLSNTILDTFFSQPHSVVGPINSAFTYILGTIREQTEAYENQAKGIYEYIEALKKLQREQERQEEITTRSAESSSSSSPTPSHRVGRATSNTPSDAAAGATYIFNSPVAVTPTKAAQLMKKTAQQLALDF